MENTLENKAKYFALYWGQSILRFPIVDEQSPHAKPANVEIPSWALYKEYNYWSVQNGYLELKSLLSITNEDVMEVAKIYYSYNQYAYSDHNEYIEDITKEGRDIIQRLINGTLASHSMLILSNILDYLRSKGYALPWMGLSVEQQIEFGWVKLKEN